MPRSDRATRSFKLLPSRQKVFAYAGYFSILSVIVGLGYWGHKTHWSLLQAGETSDIKDDRAATVPTASIDAIRGTDGESGRVVRVISLPSEVRLEDVGIETAPAETRTVYREIVASGVVNYDQSRLAELSARVPGTIWRVEKQTGEEVRQGEVLAIIESIEVGEAKADLLHGLAQVDLSEKVLKRMKSVGSRIVPLNEMQQAEAEQRKAQIELFNAEQALINLGLPLDIQQLRPLDDPKLQQELKFLGLPAHIREQLNPATTTANLLPIYAAFDGTLIGRELAVGEVISSSENRIELADIRRMWIFLNVRVEDADLLRVGQEVTFTSQGREVQTSLVWISTRVDEKTQTIRVRCDADNPEVTTDAGQPTGRRLLLANAFGNGRIRIAEVPGAVVVPTIAVQYEGDFPVVFVKTNNRDFEVRHVRLGVVNDTVTQITDGVKAGEPVAALGSHVLKSELIRKQATGES